MATAIMSAMHSKARPHSHAIDISEKKGVRFLHFGSAWVQGAMRIARPWSLELAYTREMMAGLLLRPDSGWPRRALLIGLGAGSLTKFIYRQLPACRIRVVEINPQVEAIARQYFNLPDDPGRLRISIGDGAEHMLRDGDSHDFILVDGFDPEARPGVLDTLPFYLACRARLSDTGLLAVNLLGRNRGSQASAERIHQAFDGRSIVFPSCESGNAIAFAAAGKAVDTSLEELRETALTLKQITGLDLLPTVNRLQLSTSLAAGRLIL